MPDSDSTAAAVATTSGSRWVPAPTLDAVRAGSTVLEKGHRGPAVAHVQRLLGITADEKFGGGTEEAVAGFQARKGMQIDPGYLGKVGRFTLAAIEQAATLPPIPVAAGDAGAFDPGGLLDGVHPELRRRVLGVVAALAARGMRLRVNDGMRTFAEQDKLYRKGRHLVGGEWVCAKPKCRDTVTNARGGYSNHNYGLAVDCYPVLDGKVFYYAKGDAATKKRFAEVQKAIGEEGERVGLTWGGRWTSPYDPPHLQLLGQTELSPRRCLEIHRAAGGSMQAVWDEATRLLSHRSL